MKGMKKWISLALSAGLMAGMLCTGALASEGPWGHGGSSSSVTPEDASQGTVAQVGDSVQVTLNAILPVQHDACSICGSDQETRRR